MEHSNEPLDPLPEVLPDVDLPCTCGNDGRCDNSGKRCANYRLATLYFASGTPFYKPKDRNTGGGFVYRVPWSLVRAALAQTAEVKCYGTQPKESPKTLPPGTEWVASCNYGESRYRFRLLSEARLDGQRWLVTGAYERIWPDRERMEGPPVGNIVPISKEDLQAAWNTFPAAPHADPTTTGATTVAADPYLAHRAKLAADFRVTDPEGAIFTKMKSADDWRGNYQREAVRAEKQRKPVEHPNAFPEAAWFDAPSCDP